MERSDLVRRLVLSSRDGARFGLTIERPEVVSTLAGLIADGMAKAYLLSGKKHWSTELEGMPAVRRAL